QINGDAEGGDRHSENLGIFAGVHHLAVRGLGLRTIAQGGRPIAVHLDFVESGEVEADPQRGQEKSGEDYQGPATVRGGRIGFSHVGIARAMIPRSPGTDNLTASRLRPAGTRAAFRSPGTEGTRVATGVGGSFRLIQSPRWCYRSSCS